jgi:transposase
MLKESETLGGTAELVLSVFGVGPVVAASLLAFLPELGQLDEKEIASLAGLAPMAHDSGQRGGRRHIAEGRSKVRRVLYMAVVAGLRSNAEVRKVYTA